MLSLVFVLALLALGILSASTQPQPILARPARTDKSGNISADEVWTLAGSPYTLTGNVTVGSGAVLTVEAGVEVRGTDGTRLEIKGELRALGTTLQPITFTSAEDSGPGQWGGLYFHNDGSGFGGLGHLRHVVVRYAGQQVGFSDAAITVRNVQSATFRLESSHVLSNALVGQADYGLNAQDSLLLISDTVFADNGDVTTDVSLFLQGNQSSLQLTHSTLEGGAGDALQVTGQSNITVTDSALRTHGGYGLQTSSGASLWVTDTLFSDNGAYPLRTEIFNLPYVLSNTFAGNTPNHMYLEGTLNRAKLARDLTLTADNGLTAYEIDGEPTVIPSVTLTLAPNVTVMFGEGRELQVEGHLQSNGTPTQPVTLTALIDQWNGLFLNGVSGEGTAHLIHTVVRDGQQYNIQVQNVDQGEVRLDNCQILSATWTSGLDYGLHARNSRVIISNSLFANNGDATADIALASDTGSTLYVTQTTFLDNAGWPIQVESDDLHHVVDNTFSGNGQNRIAVEDNGSVGAGARLRPQTGLEAYEVMSKLTVDPGITLTLDPGVTLMGRNLSILSIQGHLDADGSAHPITFTSVTDDASEQWSGLDFNGGSGFLRNVVVRYAGDPRQGIQSGIQVINGGYLHLESSHVISNAASGTTDYGLKLTNQGQALVTDTILADNGNTVDDYGIFASGNSVLTLTHSHILRNAGYALSTGPNNLTRIMTNNVFADNGYDRVLITQGAVAQDVQILSQTGLEAYELKAQVTVNDGVTLTIADDILMMGQSGVRLEVQGHLDAVGTRPITLTSALDSGPEQWQGLFFNGGSGHLRNVTVRYAGQSYLGQQAIFVRGGNLRLESSHVVSNAASSASDHALRMINQGQAVVSDTVIAYNGNTLDDLGISVANNGVLTMTHTTLAHNAGYAMRMAPNNLSRIVDNAFDGNGYDRILIVTGDISEDTAVHPQTGLEGYEVQDDWIVSTGVTLTVDPGVTLMSQDNVFIRVQGHLDALGTQTPITFTSAANSAPAEWIGLKFNGGTGHLRNVVLRYAGQDYGLHPAAIGLYTVPKGAVHIQDSAIISNANPSITDEQGIYVENSYAILEDTAFVDNGTYGMRVTQGSVVTATQVTFRDNDSHGIAASDSEVNLLCAIVTANGSDGVYLSGTSIDLTSITSSIYDNAGMGINNTTGQVVDARYTWWGDPSGPGGVGPGAGDEVSSDVLFDPWLDQEGCLCDLSLEQVDTPDPAIAGTALDYVLTLFNAGPGDATQLVITETLPGSFALTGYAGETVSWCGASGDVVTCTLDSLPADHSAAVTLTLAVDPAARETYTSTGYVAGAELDHLQHNNLVTESTYIEAEIDLTLTKEDAPDPAAIGGRLAYTMTVNNLGPSTATDVVLTDTLPADVTPYTYPPQCTPGAEVVCTLGTVPPGTGVTVTLGVTVEVQNPGWITNTAHVTGLEPDIVPANNAFTVTTLVGTAADIAVAKTHTPEPVAAGDAVVYTLTVTNRGPSPAPAVRVTDTLPSALALRGYSAGCAEVGNDLVCQRASLVSGERAVFTLTATVDPTARGLLTNTLRASSDEYDPRPANDAVTTTTTLEAVADLTVSAQAHPDPVVAGTGLRYTVTVTNAGPSQATGVVLTDTLPVSVTLDAAPGCTPVDGGLTCPVAALAPGAHATFTLTATVDPAARGALTHTLTATSIERDPQQSNDTITTTTSLEAEADLAVSTLAYPDPVVAGTGLRYTVTVANAGASQATGVTLTHALPVSVTLDAAPGCTPADGGLACPVAALAPGAHATFTLTATVDPAARGALTHTATVTSAEPDPTPGDRSVTTVTALEAEADLAVTKAQASDALLAGTAQAYTVTVTNQGPSTAFATALTDTLPADVTPGAVRLSTGACAPWAGRALVCELGDLEVGIPVTLTLVATPTVAGPITNTASAASVTPDPAPQNDSAEVTATVGPVIDLGMDKRASFNATFVATPLRYTLHITNAGPSPATGVVLTDTLPLNVTLGSIQTSRGTCTATDRSVVCDLLTLTPGDHVVVSLVVTPTATGTFTNTATVTGAETELRTGNNTDSAVTTVEQAGYDIYLPLAVRAAP
jgi:uncharacterized repeat protein (TIGR01451 family)